MTHLEILHLLHAGSQRSVSGDPRFNASAVLSALLCRFIPNRRAMIREVERDEDSIYKALRKKIGRRLKN